VADELAISRELVQEVVLASLLKDVGKITLDPALSPADEDLTSARKEALREHAPAGARLLEHITFPWNVLPVIRHHHERYDGRGYPDGLKGREIPSARGSSPSSTPTSRCARPALTAWRFERRRPSTSSSEKPDSSSTPKWSRR
jgi:HD-like signal output (HDOD) protein